MILAPTTSQPKTTKGAEMLLAIPATRNKPKQTLLALINSGTSASLNYHHAVYKYANQKNVRNQHGQHKEGFLRHLRKCS